MRKVLVLGLLVSFALAFSLWALPPYPPPTIEARTISVIDGDTITVQILSVAGEIPDPRLKPGEVVEVRYIGIDAQETHHPRVPLECFGQEATEFNADLVKDETLYLELDQELWDRYDRLLAYVYLDSQGYSMINAILVALGYADTMPIEPNTRYAQVFETLEDTAISLGLGMWSYCVIPWEEAAKHVGEEIVVKGEVKSVGFSARGTAFLNIGNPYPEIPRFTVVIWPECLAPFEERFGDLKEYFEGRTVCVYGEIELYKGVPEIELCDPDYIWSCNEQ